MADSAAGTGASTSDGNPRELKRANTGAPALKVPKRAQPEPPSVSHTDTDIVDLNVGGEPKAVLRSTLRRHEWSMMAVMFDAAKEWSFARKDGVIFLDRDPKAFDVILRFLRTGFVDYTADASWDAAIDAEMEYWGLRLPEDTEADAEADVVDTTPDIRCERSITYHVEDQGKIYVTGSAPMDFVDNMIQWCEPLFKNKSWPATAASPEGLIFTTAVFSCMPSGVYFCDVLYYDGSIPNRRVPVSMLEKVTYFNMQHNEARKAHVFVCMITK